MPILLSNEILAAVKDELSNAKLSVQLITAYCKEHTFDNLSSCIKDSVKDKTLLVRFRKDDVVKGSTDFAILNKAIDSGWNVYIRFDLHAKTYVVDNKRCFIGSANLTDSGMNLGKHGNMEMATLVDMEYGDLEKIKRLYTDAIRVDKALIAKMESQLSKEPADGRETVVWSEDITRLFTPKITTLFSHELPDVSEVKNGDYIPFLDYKFDGDREQLKDELRWSNAYLWLLNTLENEGGCMYFGAITEKLHNALISDPKPYRKDVKQMLSNLLELIEETNMDGIIIDRPNYSQRVRLSDYIS